MNGLRKEGGLRDHLCRVLLEETGWLCGEPSGVRQAQVELAWHLHPRPALPGPAPPRLLNPDSAGSPASVAGGKQEDKGELT